MTKHTLRNGLILLILCIFLAGLSFLFANRSTPESLIGKSVFSNSINHALEIDRIIITTLQGEIKLEIQDNFWHVVSGSDYYGNIALINNLLTNINKSTYYSRQNASPELLEHYGLNLNKLPQNAKNTGIIKIYARKKLMDQINIGLLADNGLYTYAYVPGSSDIWLISGSFILPQYQYSWFQQPLFSYAEKTIKAISSYQDGRNDMVMRLENKAPFVNREMQTRNLKPLLEEINYMLFTNVIRNSDFDEAKFPKKSELKIITFAGLINTLTIYTDGQQFWMQTKLSSTSLTTGNINAYIENNKFLFEGWTFEISPLTGSILFTSEF